MTSTNNFISRNHDQQDGAELHLHGELSYVTDAGHIIKVRGTDTEDVEAVVINIGTSIHLPKNHNAEVLLLSMGSDTNHKFAILTIPRDKQRQWAEGTGGIQNPTDPDKAVEFNAKRTHLTEPNVAIGEGIFEVIGGEVIIRANVKIEGNVEATGNVGAAGNLQGVNVEANVVGSNPANPTIPGWST